MELKEYRMQINSIDKEIVQLLKQRLFIAMEIGKFKKSHNIPILDSEREKELLTKVGEDSLPEFKNYILNIYQEILENSKNIQRDKI